MSRRVAIAFILLVIAAEGSIAQNAASDLPRVDLWGDFPRVDASLPFQPLEGAWPKRVERGRLNGVIVPVTEPIMRPEGSRVFWRSERLPLPVKRTPEAEALLGESASRVLLEGDGSFVVRAEPRPDDQPIPRRKQNLADLTFRFISGRELEPETVLIERTWFAYFAPHTKGHHRGTVLLMPGMFGTPEGVLSGLTRSLQARGVGVLRMISQPARFTERLDVNLDPLRPVEDQVLPVAREFDDRGAECAYAAEGAWAHLQETRPEVVSLPKGVIGFSAGAITLPTVVARQPGFYNAAIGVGSGCHWWLLIERSNYRTLIDAIEFHWPVDTAEAAREAARQAYLQAARLDGYNTAQALRGLPVLMIQGTSDLAVPTPLGDCVWERAGRPERWLVEGGHEVLFMQLAERFDRIGDWLLARFEESSRR
jgi:pimeloyl-ACP methyl ester carboxylesterase